MAESIHIQLLDIYGDVTDDDIKTGKNYILRRESAVHGLSALIEELLKDAAEEIIRACYQANADPKTYQIGSKGNEKLYERICRILDALEEKIMELLLLYAERCTKSEEKKRHLLPWILALGKGKTSMRTILANRIWMFARDMESAYVATRLAGDDVVRAVNRTRTYIKDVYGMPEMKNAFRQGRTVRSYFIRTHGVKHGNVGNSNSEAVNILRFVRTILQQAWMHQQWENYEERGAEGYYVLRGSNFPCAICEEQVGFHLIDDIDGYPPYHSNCCCYTVPIFKT